MLKRIIISYGMYNHGIFAVFFAVLKILVATLKFGSKVTHKNELLQKFCDCWGLAPAGPNNFSYVKNYMLQQM